MTRRPELDWLRVLLFALLVPHHVAIGFVDWGADIYQFVNDRLAGDGMTLFIYWSHGWRLPSLFLIAGIGTWFLTGRGAGPRFMAARLSRLLVPALFGALVLNAAGGYAIARMTGDPGSFPAFWSGWLDIHRGSRRRRTGPSRRAAHCGPVPPVSELRPPDGARHTPEDTAACPASPCGGINPALRAGPGPRAAHPPQLRSCGRQGPGKGSGIRSSWRAAAASAPSRRPEHRRGP